MEILVCVKRVPTVGGAITLMVVGGGRGVGSAEGFGPLEELASLLGGVVGVSRVVTSEGWRPHAQQVGQTGTKITRSFTSPAASAARSSTSPAAPAPGTSSRSTPIRMPR